MLTIVVPTRFNKKKILLNVTKLSDLAFNDAVAAMAQAQQSMLMQLLLHVHQLSILQYFMLQQLPHDNQLLQLSTQKPHVTFYRKIPILTHIIAYQEQYYCPIPTNIIA